MTMTPQEPWLGQPYSVKRHGATLGNCDSEPVKTPGCIQAHGALLVLESADFTIVQASENTEAVLGWQAAELCGQGVAAVIGTAGEAQLREFLEKENTEGNPLYLLTLPASGDILPFDITVHTVDGVVVLEFEATGQSPTSHPDYYGMVKKAVTRLQMAASLQDFCNIATNEVRALTGFDRVMVYKFHADLHGEVYAESRLSDLPPWLGLHYPAEDIPKPAREIFTKIWVRPVPDVRGGLAELVPLVNGKSGIALDMTNCCLRGASVMYTEYLQNMKVSACLTMAIRRGDELWGLIACHHYAGPKHIPYPLRAACEFLAQVISLQHKAAEDREHSDYRLKLARVHQQLAAAATAEDIGLANMIAGTPSLLDGIQVGGAALYHQDRWWLAGETPSAAELSGLSEWLFNRVDFCSAGQAMYSTDCLERDYPLASAYASVASGLLAVPLLRTQRSVLMWFRPEIIRNISWGGNPDDKPVVPGPHGPRLTPRCSFELFKESVYHHASPWHYIEIDAAIRLRYLVMELVVSHAERLASLNAELARSNEELDAFAYVASHDLKEPLRGIQKYAYQLLEDAAVVDEENRKKLDRLMRLTQRMDSLIDSLLYFSRVGKSSLSLETVDLNDVLTESIEMVGFRISGPTVEIVIPSPLPLIQCDRVRVRELLVNLLSNALKYNDKAVKRVEIGCVFPEQNSKPLEGSLLSAFHPTFYVRDNGIGIQPKHLQQVFKLFKRLHGREEYGGGTGVGLAIVKKCVDRHGGRVWVDSNLGQGSTFYFTLEAEAV